MNAQPDAEPTASPATVIENEEAQIREQADLLLQFLQADPTHKAYIDRTIRQHLGDRVTMETWGHILNGLNLYAGEDLATFILLALLQSNDADFLARLENNCPAEAWLYLRGLMALYSDDLREAHTIFGENPQGWKTVNRRVYYDHLTDMWHATFEVIKFNGEQFLLDETPNSAIVLCQAILDALNAIPAELAPQAADPGAVENLIGLFSTFIEHFAPTALEEGHGD